MKLRSPGFALLAAIAVVAAVDAQAPSTGTERGTLRVRLLGTNGGPTFNAQRLGISTLVEAGTETLVFDCGRGSAAGLSRLGIAVADVRKVFITHLHSDHVVGMEHRAHRGLFLCCSLCALWPGHRSLCS